VGWGFQYGQGYKGLGRGADYMHMRVGYLQSNPEEC